MSNIKPIPKNYHSVTPHLTLNGAAKAIDFYKKAFGATERFRVPTPDGKLAHSEIEIGGSAIMISDEFPEWGAIGPKENEPSPVTISVYVEDVDKVFNQAVEAGAKVTMPLDDQFWGDRYGKLVDPFGHHWALASHIEDVTPEELAKRSAKIFGGESKN